MTTVFGERLCGCLQALSTTTRCRVERGRSRGTSKARHRPHIGFQLQRMAQRRACLPQQNRCLQSSKLRLSLLARAARHVHGRQWRPLSFSTVTASSVVTLMARLSRHGRQCVSLTCGGRAKSTALARAAKLLGTAVPFVEQRSRSSTTDNETPCGLRRGPRPIRRLSGLSATVA